MRLLFSMYCTVGLGLSSLSASLSAEDRFTPGRDQTVIREMSNSIRTIYTDVRTPFGDTIPALGMMDWSQISLTLRSFHRYADDLVDPNIGRALQADLLARGYLWSRGVLEVEALGEASPIADPIDVSDINLRLAVTVAKWRYAGISLVGGWGTSVGSGKVLAIGHEADFYRPSYLFGFRTTSSIGYTVINFNLNGDWTPAGTQQYPAGWVDKDTGDVLTTGKPQEVNTVHTTALLGASYRPSRFYRVGGEASLGYDFIQYDPSTEGTLAYRLLTVQALVEVNPLNNLSFTGGVGVQPDQWNEKGGSVVWSGSLLTRF